MPKDKVKILLVEDDEMLISMYKTKLESVGYEMVIAKNGVDGIKLAKEEKPNLIMLDVILPQLDGFSVLEALKKDKAAKSIPIVMLTNLGTEEDKRKGKELGAKDYLVKANLTPTQFSDKVKEYLK